MGFVSFTLLPLLLEVLVGFFFSRPPISTSFGNRMNYFKAIAAMSLNRVIGRDNRIPWHLPEDFKWFKRVTTGQVVVMGRKTFESLGRALPNRETIVVSSRGTPFSGARTVRSLGAIDLSLESREIFICGGARLYEEALPLCSDLYLTLVKRQLEGDTFFPPFEHLFVPVETIQDSAEFSVIHYRNQGLPQMPAKRQRVERHLLNAARSRSK
jgi:dihydrofolate reductase